MLPTFAAQMVTGSQFAVSESGAATVSVPLQVPRGIAGMEPELSLSYSSGAGNGLLGLGWTLTGPSVVSRCPKNMISDGVRGVVTFGVGDRYCLDGQRLELDALANTDANYGTASTYKTSRDSFSRITAIGQYQAHVPNSFKVETKSGLIMEYGISANSQVLTAIPSGLGTNTISRWMLQRISDRNGNFVEFVYCGGTVSSDGTTCTTTEGTSAWLGSKVLQYVRYTNRAGAVNGEYAVMFGYSSRPDSVTRYYRGSVMRQSQRLSSIETYRGFAGPAASQRGALVRRYAIAYEPTTDSTGKSIRATNASRLQQIQESDGAGNTLPPLQFTYGPDTVFGTVVTQTASQSTGRPPPSGDQCGGTTHTMCP